MGIKGGGGGGSLKVCAGSDKYGKKESKGKGDGVRYREGLEGIKGEG